MQSADIAHYIPSLPICTLDKETICFAQKNIDKTYIENKEGTNSHSAMYVVYVTTLVELLMG